MAGCRTATRADDPGPSVREGLTTLPELADLLHVPQRDAFGPLRPGDVVTIRQGLRSVGRTTRRSLDGRDRRAEAEHGRKIARDVCCAKALRVTRSRAILTGRGIATIPSLRTRGRRQP